MALHTKRQFADLAGVQTKDLSNYIKRGQVILKDNKPCKCKDKKKCECLIDDSNEKNKGFLEKRGVTAPAPKPTAQEKQLRMVRPLNKKEREAEENEEEDDDFADDMELSGDFATLQKRKLVEQIRELDKKNKLYDAKIQKLFEEIIPREHAVHLIVAQSEACKGAWLRATETFITQFSAQNQMSREEIVFWRKELTGVVNTAVETSVQDAKKNLRKIAREFSGKKGKGERDDN